MSQRPKLQRVLASLIALLVVASCGGGGGGGGGGKGGGGGSGKGKFSVTAGPGGQLIGGLNNPVTLQFNKEVDPNSVHLGTVQIVTIADSSGQATAPPGSVASVNFSVTGSTLTITPTLAFTPEAVQYGFAANALYEIAFANELAGATIVSTASEVLSNTQATFFFRTPNKGSDPKFGYPKVRAFLVDDIAGVSLPGVVIDADLDGSLLDDTLALFGNPIEIVPATPPIEIQVSPVRHVIFLFEEALIPTSVVNAGDASSSQIQVSLNTAPLPQFEPQTLPGMYAFLKQQLDLTIVHWSPQVIALPPAGFVFVEVGAGIQDLALNTKLSQTGNPTADLFAALRVGALPSGPDFEHFEPFDNATKEDGQVSSADWGGQLPGFLVPVLGGGTGKDGNLLIDPAGSDEDLQATQLPSGATIDFALKTIRFPTVEESAGGEFLPRTYELESLELPMGWTLAPLFDPDGDDEPDPSAFMVQSPGHPLDGQGAPLRILCTGNVIVDGTIDVRGVDAPVLIRPTSQGDPLFTDYRGQGGAGAVALLAAGSGGKGGDSLLANSLGNVAIPLKSPAATPAFESVDGKLKGATGRSTILTATTLFDPNTNLLPLDNDPATPATADPDLLALLEAGEILLQPNLGVGSSLLGNSGTANQDIDENHPVFRVTGVSVTGGQSTITVEDSPGQPTMTQSSLNIGVAPIAAGGDSYLIGALRGREGSALTTAGRGGRGALPYVVVNEGAFGITTTGGGGGGGGAIGAGEAGDSDGPASNPLVNQRGGSGGIALDDSPGAEGGAGAIRGVVTVMGATSLELASQTQGRPLVELAGAPLVGAFLVPNAPADGWMFEIAAFDGTTFTLLPIQAETIVIELTDGPGADGPGLSPGSDVSFLIVPSLDVGGAGGGGSGVSVTGTVNDAATNLPRVTPGAGGGAGGGTLLLETARDLTVGSEARVLADGGVGGRVFDPQVIYAGGGGGGGGNLTLRAGRTLTVFQGARLSVLGGEGGSSVGFGKGGQGGSGWLRLEDFADSLNPASFANVTFPPVVGEGVGRMLGLPQGLAQSVFYQALVPNPGYVRVEIEYVADADDDRIAEPHVWSFGESGVDGGPTNQVDPPFRILFNVAPASDIGQFDDNLVNGSFFNAADLVSARVGLALDVDAGVLLYAVGEACTQIHRLDRDTLLPVGNGPGKLLLPVIPANQAAKLDLVSLAVDNVRDEIFLAERVTRRVHVIDRTTGAYLRQITLPVEPGGPLVYDAVEDRLLFIDNRSDRLLAFQPRDAGAAEPATTNFDPATPMASWIISRDDEPLDVEIAGLALDPAGPSLWCTDAVQGLLFELSLAPGSEGSATSGVQRYSPLVSGADGVVPSALAFDDAELLLVHATVPEDARVQALDPADVSLTDAELDLPGFGVLLPEAPRSMADGDLFLRFRIVIDGAHESSDGTTFGGVRIDSVRIAYENKAF